MSESDRRERTRFIRDEPVFWLVALYAAAFLGCSVMSDLWVYFEGSATFGAFRYWFPMGLAVQTWFGLRGWAQRVLVDHGGAET